MNGPINMIWPPLSLKGFAHQPQDKFWNFATEQWADINYDLDALPEMAFGVAEAYLAGLSCDWFSHPWLPVQTQWKHHILWNGCTYFLMSPAGHSSMPISIISLGLCWFTFTRHGNMIQHVFLGSILWACQIGIGGPNLQVPSWFLQAGVCGVDTFNRKAAHVLAVAPLWLGMKPRLL